MKQEVVFAKLSPFERLLAETVLRQAVTDGGKVGNAACRTHSDGSPLNELRSRSADSDTWW